LIGNGVAFDPMAFLEEAAQLEALGASLGDRLIISRKAHLILPYHPLVEKIAEERKGKRMIGTTNRGIGPSYEDKAARSGIRVGDLCDLDVFREKLEANVAEKNVILRGAGIEPLVASRVYEQYADFASRIIKYIGDVSLTLNDRIRRGDAVLFEGAQGTLLDLDHGTYPYVTSSSSTAGGVCTGLGIGPTRIQAVLGVAKAYTTRVGSGPFPTEIGGEKGRVILERGNEFGATTGRPRRCGWFDAVAVAYACRLNGCEKIVLTKPDILDVFPEIPVCLGYSYKGELLKNFPTEPWILDKVTPQYRTMKGWQTPIHRTTDRRSLPASFVDYIRLLEDSIEAKVVIISTGVGRGDSLFVDEELEGIVDIGKIRAGLD
jgi:adenylosuccinate synthase